MRIPELQGALNFRDMGGYQATDGRSVKWKTLYRSGTSHALTPQDIDRLSAVGLRFAFDLRSDKERSSQPSRFTQIHGLRYRYREHDHIAGDIRRLLESPGVLPKHTHELMISVYRDVPYDFQEPFRELFHLLEQGHLPLVFNCAAGKDRTGIAAALVLAALGIPREVILEDYMLTEHCFDRSCELLLNDNYLGLFAQVEREVWEPLMRVHADYLNAMFDGLTESRGSVANYLAQDLGVDAACLNRLRSHLLV
jgi:protein-tyrosine phosphatase